MDYITLIYRSHVRNGDYIEKLVFLRAFQEKFSSWYETFGFVFQKEKDRMLLYQSMRELYALYIPEISSECLDPHMLSIRKNSTLYKDTYDILKKNKIYQNLSDKIIKSLRKDLICWI